MTLDAQQLQVLCRRRDAGVISAAAAFDDVAAVLLSASSPQERQALVEDGHAAREEMIVGSLGLVGYAIARFRPTAGLERSDFFQEGVVGLASAVDRYDPARSNYWSAFALPHIHGAVASMIRTRGGDLRSAQGRLVGQLEREIARRESLGLSTGTAGIAGSLGLTERTVVTGLGYRRPNDITATDLPDRTRSDGQQGEPAASLLFMLPPLERRALQTVHGDAAAGRTIAQLATDLGLSARQLRTVLDSGHRHLSALMRMTDPEFDSRPLRSRGEHKLPVPAGRNVKPLGPQR